MSIRDDQIDATSRAMADRIDKVIINNMTATNTATISSLDDPLEDSKLDDPSEQFKTFVHNAAFMEKVFRGLGKDISELNTMTVNEFLQICAEQNMKLDEKVEHGRSRKDLEMQVEMYRQQMGLKNSLGGTAQQPPPEIHKWPSTYLGPEYNEPSLIEKLRNKWGR